MDVSLAKLTKDPYHPVFSLSFLNPLIILDFLLEESQRHVEPGPPVRVTVKL